MAHVFYVTVGAETLVATLQRCTVCRRDFPYDPRRFRAMLAPDMRCSANDLMRQTNPALAEEVGVALPVTDRPTQPDPDDAPHPPGFSAPPPAASMTPSQLLVAAILIVGAGLITVPYIVRQSRPPPPIAPAPRTESDYPITIEHVFPGMAREKYQVIRAKGLHIQDVNGRAGVVSGETIELKGATIARAGDSVDRLKEVLGPPDALEPGPIYSRLYYRGTHLYVSCHGQTVASFSLVPMPGR